MTIRGFRISGTTGYALFVALVVVVVLVYLFLSGFFESGDDEPEEAAAPTPVVVGAADAPGAVVFEQSARVGPLDIAIERVEWTTELLSDGRTRQAAQRFAVVRLNVVNRGSAPYRLNPDQVEMTAAGGRSYALDAPLAAGAAVYEDNPTLALPATFQPDLPVALLLVFRLPNDAGGLVLRIHGHYVDFALAEER